MRRNLAGRALLLGWVVLAAPAAAAPVDTVSRLMTRLEQGDDLGFPIEQLPERAATLSRELRDWRQRHPDEPSGVLATAQLAWLSEHLSPSTVDAGGEPPASVQRSLAELERLQDGNGDDPEVDFWRARLHAVPVLRRLDGQLTARPLDLDTALAHARRAHAKAPEQQRYRDALASWLADAYRDGEARKLLRSDDTHPVATLLQDLAAIPLPTDAQLLQDDSRRFAEQQMLRGRVADHPYLRGRVYLLRGTASDYENRCRKAWPRFRLLVPERPSRTPDWQRQSVQVLLLGGGPPRPIASLAQLDVAAMDGIALTLVEMTTAAAPESARRRSPAGVPLPDDLPATFTYLYVLNDRTLHTPSPGR